MVPHSYILDTCRTPEPTPCLSRAMPSSKVPRPAASSRCGRSLITFRLSPGIALGYRRNAGAGKWAGRVADGGAEWIKRVALADDLEGPSPPHVLSYWQALDTARALARRQPGDVVDESRPLTVAEALDRYESDLKARGGDPYN